MYGERFLEKETAVSELEEQVGFCSGEWEDDFFFVGFFFFLFFGKMTFMSQGTQGAA